MLFLDVGGGLHGLGQCDPKSLKQPWQLQPACHLQIQLSHVMSHRC